MEALARAAGVGEDENAALAAIELVDFGLARPGRTADKLNLNLAVGIADGLAAAVVTVVREYLAALLPLGLSHGMYLAWPCAIITACALWRSPLRPLAVLGAVGKVLGTLVLIGGQLLGKPGGDGEAAAMLSMLSGRTQTVLSAIGIKLPGRPYDVLIDRADVIFRQLSASDIAAYVATGECRGAAGAYRLQKTGYTLVERIDGDWTTVVGLPLQLMIDYIRKAI